MNTQNSTFNQENSFDQENDLDNSRRYMEEEIEFLREQVESWKQALCHECQVTNTYIQELAYTKQELELMNEEISTLIHSQQQPLDEAQGLDKTVSEGKTVGEFSTEVIIAPNPPPVELNKFESLDRLIYSSNLDKWKEQSRELKAQSAQIIAHSSRLAAQSDTVTSQSRKIQVRSREIREDLSRVNQQEMLFHQAL